MTTREKFVTLFGENEARLIEAAAQSHRGEKEKGNVGRIFCETFAGRQIDVADDQFLLDIATCISWECISNAEYRANHGFTVDEAVMRDWVKKNAMPPEEYRDPAGDAIYAKYLA